MKRTVILIHSQKTLGDLALDAKIQRITILKNQKRMKIIKSKNFKYYQLNPLDHQKTQHRAKFISFFSILMNAQGRQDENVHIGMLLQVIVTRKNTKRNDQVELRFFLAVTGPLKCISSYTKMLTQTCSSTSNYHFGYLLFKFGNSPVLKCHQVPEWFHFSEKLLQLHFIFLQKKRGENILKYTIFVNVQ